MAIEYLTLFFYFALLLICGSQFAKFNKNISDFVRGGAQGTWWMVGTSVTIGGISAFTFTGNGSAAFESGPTLLVIYCANLASFALGGLFLARWYRQTRAITGADVIRDRFGTPVEQFSIYSGLLLGPLGSAIQLWALSLFVSAIFGFPLLTTIIVVGLIVLLYSVAGGKWAVMATDVVQGVILYAITILVGILAFIEVGGWDGFSQFLQKPEIAADFQFIKPAGYYNDNRFTWEWAVVIFIMQLLTQINLASAGRYLAVKDGREAVRTAWWAFFLMAVGSLLWFIPPMVARFLYSEQVLDLPLDDPATGAYAVAALNLLPDGMMGVMIAAMFAATMSSMDSGINGQTGVIVHNLIGRLRELLKLPPLEDSRAVRLCRIVSILLGLTTIVIALVLATQGVVKLFDTFLLIGAVIGTPIALPLLVGLIFRKLPSWSYFLIFGFSVLPSGWSILREQLLGQNPWTIQERGGWVLLFGLLGTALSVALARFRGAAQRKREELFFTKMLTPVDFETEIGENKDAAQAVLIGKTIFYSGLLLFLLILVPNSLGSRVIVLGFASIVSLIGWSLFRFGQRSRTQLRSALPPSPPTEKPLA